MARNTLILICIPLVALGILNCEKTVRQENGYLTGTVTVDGIGVSGVTISVSSYTSSSGNARPTTDMFSSRVAADGDYRVELLAGFYRVDFDLSLDGEPLHTARYPVRVIVGDETKVDVDLKNPVPQNLMAKDDDASVLLSWEHGYGSSAYKIYRALESDNIFSLVATADSGFGTILYIDTPPAIDTYLYKVTGIADQIESAASSVATVEFTGSISPPTGFTATDNITHISLQWTSKTNAIRYKIYRTTADAPNGWTLIDSVSQASYEDEPGTYDTYLYYVTAVSFLDIESGPSATRSVEFDGRFDPPSGLVLIDRGSNLYLNWLGLENIGYYNIYRSEEPQNDFARIDSSFVPYYQDIPTQYRQYYYGVTVVGPNGMESDMSEIVGTFFDGRLDPPDQVFAENRGLSVEVSWSEVLWTAAYIVYRSDDGGTTFNQISRIGGENLSMINVPPEAGQYYYKVATETLDGVTGTPSVGAGVFFTNNLPAPANVIAENFGTFVAITWDEVPDANSYTVHRSTSPNGAYSQIGSSANTEYEDVPQIEGGYYYKVRAIDTLGHESPLSFYAYTYFTDVPQAPFNVTAEDLSYRVRVSWESIDSSFTFIIYRSVSANGDYSPIDTVEGLLEIIDWPASAGHYYYKIRAEHPSHGSSALSEYGHVYFSGILGMPSNLNAIDRGLYIEISWDAVEGASEYEVFRGISESQLDSIQIVYVPHTTDVPDSSGTYYYAVLAKTQGGLESPRSAPVGVVFNPY